MDGLDAGGYFLVSGLEELGIYHRLCCVCIFILILRGQAFQVFVGMGTVIEAISVLGLDHNTQVLQILL